MRKFLSVTGVVALLVLLWYLFVKPYDYRVTFIAKTFPGAINQTVKLWNETLENPQPILQEDLENFTQRISLGDSTYTYKWKISPITDSTSRIRVYIRDVDHSLANKIKIPFMETDFEKGVKKTLTAFHSDLTQHISEFKVTILGEAAYPDSFCACISLKGTLFEKALGMMQSYPLFTSILPDNGVIANGLPFIEITNWNQANDSIQYNFCTPIVASNNLPSNPEIKFKTFSGKTALKAIYNGNYITSDRAWFALQDYAKKNDIEVIPHPIEVFYNNPNAGGNEINWKAEIYMPLKEE